MTASTWLERWQRWWRRNRNSVWWGTWVTFMLLNVVMEILPKPTRKAVVIVAAITMSALLFFLMAYALFWWLSLSRLSLPRWAFLLLMMWNERWVSQKKRQLALQEALNLGKDAVPHLRKVLKAYTTMPELAPRFQRAWGVVVELLGRIKARDAVPELLDLLDFKAVDSTSETRAVILWALGEIGEPEAVPAIIPFLADLRWVTVNWVVAKPSSEAQESSRTSKRMCDWAAEALTKLGEDELVKAFWRVLDAGDKEALAFLRSHPHRKAIVKALTNTLSAAGMGVTRACNAAWALEELGAIEALPMLRMMAGWSSPDRLRKACQKAIAKLEMLSRLPRPADPLAFETSNLPRPANLTVPSTENLPRAAGMMERNGASD